MKTRTTEREPRRKARGGGGRGAVPVLRKARFVKRTFGPSTREASSRTLARERVLFVRCLNHPSNRVVAKAAAVKAAVVARPAEVPRDFRKGSPCQ